MSSSISLVPVLPNHRFDEKALARWLSGRIAGAEDGITVHQFQGGLSNPTFFLQAGDHEYVLRKQPPGNLLPGAHAVDREFRVQQALQGSAVPVAKMRVFCDDPTVIGQIFYVMDHVEGRIFSDRLLPSFTPSDRAAAYDAMNEVLAALHEIDFAAIGLSDFGRHDQYIARQVSRWGRNYKASIPDPMPEMEKVILWLEENVPAEESAAIVHGDYRFGNIILDPVKPAIVALLDWELSTIGHPLADLAYNCLPWRLPSSTERGFADIDFRPLGIPSEEEYVAAYARRRGIGEIPNWTYFLVFAMFRTAAILGGVYARAKAGNASDARSLETGPIYEEMARQTWAVVQREHG